MNDFPQVFAFYSFKGGVGRSMAVLNVAYGLAARGRNVLILDMDLEAPGLSGFLRRAEEIGDCAPGDMVDLVRWAKDFPLDVQEGGGHPDPASFPPLSDYVVNVPRGKLESLQREYSELGRVDIIPADEERHYYERLTELALGALDHDALIRVGSVLRSWLKSRRFAFDVPDYYGPNAIRTAAYDYVLVDSRTGITEIGGLCIGPLSDHLVVLTALNDQNVEGTRGLLEEVGIVAKRSSPPAEDGSARGEQPRRRDPKPTLIVASPVPAGEITTKEKRLKQLEKAVGPVAVKLSYHPQMALMESIFTRDFPDEYLAKEYNTLLHQLLRMAGDGTEFDLARAYDELRSAPPAERRREIIRKAVRFLPLIAHGELLRFVLANVGLEAISEDEDFILLDRGYRILSTASDPTRFEAIRRYANILSLWVLHSTEPELATLRREAAIRAYAQVLEADVASPRQRAETLLDRGVAYGRLGDPEKAIADFNALLEMPDASVGQKAAALVNRGVAYGKLGGPEKASADFNTVLEMADAPADQKAHALYSRGVTYGELGDSEKAIADFTAVLEMPGAPADQNANALLERGVVYRKLGDLQKAIADDTAVLEMADAPADKKAAALFNRGMAYGEVGDSEKEIADYTAVLEVPDAPADHKAKALGARGWQHFVEERYPEAIADEREALSLDPSNCSARGNLAIALLVHGQRDEALAAYDAALAMASAEHVADMAKDLNEALEKHAPIDGAEDAMARIESRRAQLED